MTMRSAAVVMMMVLVAGCGPDPDEIVKAENKKLTELEPVEAAKVEEAMSRIRYESEIIAKGGVLPTLPDSTSTDSIAAAQPEPVRNPEPRTTPPPPNPAANGEFPHHIQVGAFTSAEGAQAAAEVWEKRGFANAIAMENPNATTVYRHVVRLTGYSGYVVALEESKRINQSFRIRSYPVQIKD